MNNANLDIKLAAMKSGIKLWQIAESYGLTDTSFSRKLRKELPDKEKQKIHKIINDLKDGVQNAG